ncbi:SRPBCC family protein [Flindersiella endophytica]
MSESTHRHVRLAGDARALLIRRHYAATAAEVWDAWTRPERLRRWFAEVSGELKQGGTAVVDMTDEIRVQCRIEVCEPSERLRVQWVHPGEPDSEVELRLRAEGGGTLLELEHERLAPARAAGYGPGWEDFLERLDALVRAADPEAISWPANEAALAPVWAALDAKPLPSVAVEGETAVLRAERQYAAAPADVWSAVTDPARLRRWFATVLLESGSAWTATFTNGRATGTVRTCEADHLLVTSWKWDHEETESEVTMRLAPAGGGTRLELLQTGVEARPAPGYAAGWHAYLAVLATHLAGTDPAEEDWEAEFSLARSALRRPG